ncbi:radical SAM protein [Paenibacillus sp. FSL W8-1187]|uniref:SPL family radical SAM protein n=1 Tax=Paenibacillus sp. FSL W8-1187 TaxID=2975339 RepID=UPI0030DD1772
MTAAKAELIRVKQLLTKVKEEKMPFRWSINPYRGCMHGCSFCYARAFHSFIGMGADEFQSRILVKENAAAALEGQLHRMAARHRFDLAAMARDIGHVAIGTATDPYQPAEGTHRITRECLKVLARYQVPVSITTRSPLILRDLDLLAQCRVLSVNFSLHTLDDRLIRSLEPGSPLSAPRLQALHELREAGLPAGVFAAPILPLLSDSRSALQELMQASRACGALFLMSSLLRLTPEVKGWYYGVLREAAPEVLPEYERIFQGAYAIRSYEEELRVRIEELRLLYGLPRSLPAVEEPGRWSGEACAGPPGGGPADGCGPTDGGLAAFEPQRSSVSLGQRLAARREDPAAEASRGPVKEVLEQMALPF